MRAAEKVVCVKGRKRRKCNEKRLTHIKKEKATGRKGTGREKRAREIYEVKKRATSVSSLKMSLVSITMDIFQKFDSL